MSNKRQNAQYTERVLQIHKIADDAGSVKSKTDTVGIAETFRDSIIGTTTAVVAKKIEPKTADQNKRMASRIKVVNHMSTLDSGGLQSLQSEKKKLELSSHVSIKSPQTKEMASNQ